MPPGILVFASSEAAAPGHAPPTAVVSTIYTEIKKERMESVVPLSPFVTFCII